MIEEEIKVNFSKPMLVLKIRETYKAPYHKNKYLSLKRNNVGSKKDFIKFLENYTNNWSSGVYELQYLFSEGFMIDSNVYSTLIRFDVRDGKVVKLWKNSPYSRKEYPIWQYLGVSTKEKTKKTVKATKKTKTTKPKKIKKRK